MEYMLICPITKTGMKDPVICNKGYTFERVAIERWLEDYKTNPITRDYLDKSMLRPNRILKDIISKNPLKYESDFDKNDWNKKENDHIINKKEESLDSWSSDEEERWTNAATLEEMEYNGETFLVDIENGSIYDNWEVIGTWDFESGKPVFYEQKWQFLEESVTPIEEEPPIPEEPDTPIPEEPEQIEDELHTQKSKFHDLKEDLNINGYCRGKIVVQLYEWLTKYNKYKLIVEQKTKIDYQRVLYKFLATPHGLRFIENTSIGKTLKDKLIEFRYDNNIKEAEVWWRNIFKTRMPLKEDYS